MESVKCVIVGDESVGKSCLGLSYTLGAFYEEHIPTVFDSFSTIITVDGKSISLGLWDTAGEIENRNVRAFQYPQTWHPEVRQYCPNIPIILVGTKLDLRENEEALNTHSSVITKQQGLSMSRAIEAVSYVECSALTQKRLNIVFEEAVRAVLNVRAKPKPRSICSIL